MPIKPEVVAEFFGVELDKFESDDAFKEAAAKDWTKVSEAVTHPEVIKATTGRVNGLIMGEVKKAYKELEIPTENIKWDELKTTDAVTLLAKTAKETFGQREAKLAESLKGKGSEEAKKEFERQIAELSKKATDFETLTATLKSEIETRDKRESEREARGKTDFQWKQAEITGLKEVKFKNDLEKTGFEAVARQRFNVLFDEKGDPYWAGADGKRIQDGSKHQSFKDGAQLLKELAAELKVGDVSARAGEKVGQRTQAEQRREQPAPIRGSRILAQPGRSFSDAPQ